MGKKRDEKTGLEVSNLLKGYPDFYQFFCNQNGQKCKFNFNFMSDDYGGVSNAVFHALLDNQGPLLLLFKSNRGKLFGAFLETIKSTTSHEKDPSAFLFSVSEKQALTQLDPSKNIIFYQEEKIMLAFGYSDKENEVELRLSDTGCVANPGRAF